jgi:hypothetical protein
MDNIYCEISRMVNEGKSDECIRATLLRDINDRLIKERSYKQKMEYMRVHDAYIMLHEGI